MKFGVFGILAVFLAVFVFMSVPSFSIENMGSECPNTEGLRNSILNDFGITINDDCMLDSNRLEVIYYILQAVPESLYNVSIITTYDMTVYPNYTATREFNIIQISDIEVGESGEDSIPDDIEQYADNFSINFVHELNRNIRQKSFWDENQTFMLREEELIQNAGENHNNYIRSDYPDGFFLETPDEFFPAISDAYFQNSYLTFHLTLQRFEDGYTEPINQFLFFADVYSLGLLQTKFYNIGEDGFINKGYGYLGRNNEGQVNSLYFEEVKYKFVLDENGDVTEIVRETPGYECQDGTPYGECSEDKPLYCHNGALKNNCSTCSCEEGYECADNGYCIVSTLECSDGTLNGSCSFENYYCDNGNLVENCFICGCEVGNCESDGSCYENHPPVLEPIGNKKVNEGEELEFYVYASDQDGDYLTFFASNLPEGSNFDGETGKFSWTPGYDQTGNYWVTFAVVDDGEQPLGSDETVMITVGNVNRPPEIQSIGDVVTDENILTEFTVLGEDPDGDEVYFSTENIPGGAKVEIEKIQLNVITAEFSWAPEFGQEGNYRVKFIVSDGELNSSTEVMITVGSVNRPPKSRITHPLENQEFLTLRNILFSAADSYDPDGEELTYIWDFGDGETLTTGDTTSTHVYENTGTYNISLTASDGEMYDTQVIAIVVKEGVTVDSDNDGVEDSVDRCPDTPPLKRVNIYGCSLPKYTNFENNLTTDFSKTDLINATDITIGIPEKGMVEFRKNTIDLVGKDLNKYVEIGDMNLSIETEKLPELNKSAVVTFYNVTIRDPVMLREGFYCSDCKMISYVNMTFAFSVPHFTSYSLMAWASYSGYCGDGLCSLYESCQECKEDCGECLVTGARAPKACEELWACSGWSECDELNLRTRECTDVNLCRTLGKKPAETIECGKGQDYSSLLLFGVIVMVLVVVYLLAETYKRKARSKKMDQFELERFVKGYMYRGYTKSEIKKMLKPKGYTDKEINEVLKEVEREIF
jgi:hypothetical protein